jgi:hypothetical protein
MLLTFNKPQVVGQEVIKQIESITPDYARLITNKGETRFIGSIAGKNLYTPFIKTLLLMVKGDEHMKRANKRISL